MRTPTLIIGGLLLAAASVHGSEWSANLIGGGDFEDLSTRAFVGASGTVVDYTYFKHYHSPRTQAEIDAGTSPVRPWQFHPDYDLGRWMTVYGNGGDGYDTMTGISTYDAPRSLWDAGTNSWQPGSAVSQHNISLDPANPSNHVMESVMFRSSLGIFLQAPPNQVIGPAQLDFDYFVYDWTRESAYYNYQPSQVPVILHMWVYGVPEQGLPTWQMRWGPEDKDPGELPETLPGWEELYATPHWSDWGAGEPPPYVYTHDGFVNINKQGYNSEQWYTLSDGVTAPVPPYSSGETRTTDGSFFLSRTYPYYYIDIWLTTYSEPSDYFWLFGGRPTDVFSDAFDNISLKLTTALLGDVNLDAAVNALDISLFVQRLTSGVYQVEADINQDGLVNALDISGFVNCLIYGSCTPAAGSPVPEPTTLAGVLLWAASLSRFRR